MRVMELIKIATLVCLITFSWSGVLAKDEHVLEFSDIDFESRIGDHKTALVMFHAPWCQYCQKLKPKYSAAAEALIQINPSVALIQVDCTNAGKETCNKHSVNVIPTLKIFRNGEVSHKYEGPMETVAIVNYMKAQARASFTEIQSVSELEKFIAAQNETVVIGFFEESSDLESAFFNTVSDLKGKVIFAHSAIKDVLDKQGVNNGIVLFRPTYLHNQFEGDSVQYFGKADSAAIGIFIVKNLHGLVGYRNHYNLEDFPNPLVVAYYSVDLTKNPKETNYWRNRILRVAKKYEGEVNFAISDKNEFKDELTKLGIHSFEGDDPKIIARDAKDQIFVLKHKFSVQALKSFVNDFLQGQLKPYFDAEDVAESRNAPVTVPTPDRFADLVINNGKDTFIELYAPWCALCKSLAPTMNKLAEKLKNEDVVIAKMDADINEVPEPYHVGKYPTFYWAPKDSKDKPVPYNGILTLDSFIKYIAKFATNELKEYDRNGKKKPHETEL